MGEVDRLLDIAAGLAADLGAELGEARWVAVDREDLEVRNGDVETNGRVHERGIGVRVLADHAWGYAATHVLQEGAVRAAVTRAVALARANRSGVHVERAPAAAQRGRYETAVGRDPFEVPLAEKLELLREAAGAARDHAQIRVGRAGYVALRRRSRLRTTEGTSIEQSTLLTGGVVAAVASDGDDVQQRHHPKSYEGDVRAAGWEYVEELDLAAAAPRMAEEARQLLAAPPTPEGVRTLILDGSQLSLQIHESCGHATELDRALGEEISLAGGSFLQPDRLGGFRYGSEHVNLYADSTTEGGPGTFGWDDEGVPAGRWKLVDEGRFVGYLGSRETAGRVPGTVPGAMRSSGFSRLPIVRMVNVNLAPGSWSLEDMIADTDDGVMMAVNKSWSIDDYRLNFQFGCELGWEIRGGKITRLLKNPVYSGKTHELWRGCDAVGDEQHWRMWGWMFCGKGDPMQLMHVGHGCAPARFQNVRIGSTGSGS